MKQVSTEYLLCTRHSLASSIKSIRVILEDGCPHPTGASEGNYNPLTKATSLHLTWLAGCIRPLVDVWHLHHRHGKYCSEPWVP